ncbi:MAG: TauD/TfdA family dioxygenase [Rhodospirillaceae bacterium]|nr:TauD/TfdA family dioxygenase [Rhodospirillaceae bacterium]MBT5456920.1 TauD/TfdA family dioxygenase [Rhodospirillaceae bacterium]
MIEIVPLSDAIGAEIRGLDLREPLSDEDFRSVEQAWFEHLIILFRDQDLSYDHQRNFAARFGEVAKRGGDRGSDAEKAEGEGVMLVTNIRENGKPIGTLPDGEMMFHSDTPYTENPLKATMLYALEVPSQGGETLFSNCYKAAASLTDPVKRRLAGRDAMHVFEYQVTETPEGGFDRTTLPHFAHPVFRKHPDTGRSSLYVSELMTDEIIGLPDEESRELLETLFAHLRKEEFIYEHAWRPGDLLMWDNRCCNHARNDFPRDERRLLRRLTLREDQPVMMGDPPYREAAAR